MGMVNTDNDIDDIVDFLFPSVATDIKRNA